MYRYKGDGEGFIPGVPARDLTDAEFKEAKRLVPDLDQSDLYEHVADSEHPRLAARAEKAAAGSPLVGDGTDTEAKD